ncbi:MAG: serine hydrolase [Pseudomonadota bacterium]
MTAPRGLSYLTDDLALADRSENTLTDDEKALLALGVIAKDVGSGVFVCGRALETIKCRVVDASINGEQVTLQVDADNGTADARLGDRLRRRAVLAGDQGVVLLPPGARDVFFTPEPVDTTLTDTQPPSAEPEPKPQASVDLAALNRSVARAFEAAPDPMTTALLVSHNGKLIAERYGADAHAARRLPGWSIGKTLTALLIGRLMHQFDLDLDTPAPITAWQHGTDPRRHITLRHLLNMSSGLDFTASWAADYKPARGYPDHAYMYSGGVDVFALARSRPLRHPPGTFGAYKNSDTMLLGQVIHDLVTTADGPYRTWPQRALLSRIGISSMTLETDPYGHFMLSGHVHATARDWLRLGQFLLDDGVHNGERLLPPGFVEFLRQPAPGWRGRYLDRAGPPGWTDAIYGGHLWLNRYPPADAWPLPDDACFMLGMGGQYVFVVPSRSLVVVRLGDPLGAPTEGRGVLPDVLAGIMAAIDP